MKKFSALYLLLFFGIFLMMVLNLDFFSALLPNVDSEISGFWGESDLMLVLLLVLLAMLVFFVVTLLMKLFSSATRKL